MYEYVKVYLLSKNREKGREKDGQGPLLYVAEGSQFSTYVFNLLVEEAPVPEADVISLIEAPKNDEAEKELLSLLQKI